MRYESLNCKYFSRWLSLALALQALMGLGQALLAETPARPEERSLERLASDIYLTQDGRAEVQDIIRLNFTALTRRNPFLHVIPRQFEGGPKRVLGSMAVLLGPSRVPHSVVTTPKTYLVVVHVPVAGFPLGSQRLSFIYDLQNLAPFDDNRRTLNWSLGHSSYGSGQTQIRVRGAAKKIVSPLLPTKSEAKEGQATWLEIATPLAAGEYAPFTIHLPKALTHEGPAAMSLLLWVNERASTLVAGAVFLSVLLYFAGLVRERRHDPDHIAHILSDPPEDLSPAAARKVLTEHYDDRVFAAALISLAEKGALDMCFKDSDIMMVPTDDTVAVSIGEARLLAALFSDHDQVTLRGDANGTIKHARKVHRKYLLDHEVKLFRDQVPALLMALSLVLGGVMATSLALVAPPSGYALTSVLVLAAYGGLILKKNRPTPRQRRALLLLAILPVLAGGSAAALRWPDLMVALPYISLLAVVALAGAVLVFFALIALMSRSPYSTAIRLEVRALQRFLKAPKDHMKGTEKETLCPFEFERTLAYAIALDAEASWQGCYEGALKQAAQARGQTHYRPHWFHCDRADDLRTEDLTVRLTEAVLAALCDDCPAAKIRVA